jgi:hypothetical protein
VEPNIYESWVWNLLLVTVMVTRSLRWLLGFYNICVLLVHGAFYNMTSEAY